MTEMCKRMYCNSTNWYVFETLVLRSWICQRKMPVLVSEGHYHNWPQTWGHKTIETHFFQSLGSLLGLKIKAKEGCHLLWRLQERTCFIPHQASGSYQFPWCMVTLFQSLPLFPHRFSCVFLPHMFLLAHLQLNLGPIWIISKDLLNYICQDPFPRDSDMGMSLGASSWHLLRKPSGWHDISIMPIWMIPSDSSNCSWGFWLEQLEHLGFEGREDESIRLLLVDTIVVTGCPVIVCWFFFPKGLERNVRKRNGQCYLSCILYV